jgi:hypothetical protein
MATVRGKVSVISDIEVQQKIMGGEFHIVPIDLGAMGGPQTLFYFHPEMRVVPHFACSLCGSIVRTFSGVYKHKYFCKILKKNKSNGENNDNHDCNQAVGYFNSSLDSAETATLDTAHQPQENNDKKIAPKPHQLIGAPKTDKIMEQLKIEAVVPTSNPNLINGPAKTNKVVEQVAIEALVPTSKPHQNINPAKVNKVMDRVEIEALLPKPKPKPKKHKRMMNELNSSLENQEVDTMDLGKRRMRIRK